MPNGFGEMLRELRVEKGLGLREAARKSGIDHTLWSKYETGKRRPPNPATKPEEAEQVIHQISEVLRDSEYDPSADLLALATLPDDVPKETVESLSNHFKRTFKRR